MEAQSDKDIRCNQWKDLGYYHLRAFVPRRILLILHDLLWGKGKGQHGEPAAGPIQLGVTDSLLSLSDPNWRFQLARRLLRTKSTSEPRLGIAARYRVVVWRNRCGACSMMDGRVHAKIGDGTSWLAIVWYPGVLTSEAVGQLQCQLLSSPVGYAS